MSRGRSATRMPIRASGPGRDVKGSTGTVGSARTSAPLAVARGGRSAGKTPAHTEPAGRLHAASDRTFEFVEA